jgi:tripartite-type tricarboxylate transporter receptor subunit TctC
LPVNTTKELLALAKAENGKLTYASSGSGSGAHMAAELLISMTGIPMTHVPYKGGGPALSDVLAGHVKVLFAPAVSSLQYIQTGRLRALAITGDKRLSSLPNVPTIAESGVPGYDSTVWYAMLAPPNTQREVVARINAELVQILKDPSFKSMMSLNGIEPIGTSPEGLTSYINKETIKWSKVIKSAGIKAD